MSTAASLIHANARFTIISPSCIRMEYHPEQKFIDQPSWFAVNRAAGCGQYQARENGRTLEIITENIRLTHLDDGQPFSSANLRAVIKYGDRNVEWRFGWKNRQNLGGTLQTLDAISHPVELPDGLLARDGWYLLDDSQSHLFQGDWVDARPEGSGFDGYLFGYGLDFAAALRDLTTIGGKAAMPRKYVLGSWYSRWHNYTDDDYRQIVREYDEHNIPLDIIVMDMDWHVKPAQCPGYGWAGMPGWTGWSWNRDLIKDPQGLLDWFHEQNLHVTLNVHPHDGVRTHEDAYPEFMRLMGLDPASGVNLPFRAGDRHYMNAYFKGAHEPLEKQGVDFWWVDWQQDSIIPWADGIAGMRHLPLLNYCYYQNSEANGKRGLGFSRWSGWGDHRHPIHFSGDATCNWDMLAFEVFFTATAGNVGCFFWSHDIGGFHGKRDPEQYARWVQFGITTAAVRLHSTGDELDRRPWKWGEKVETSIRESLHLRARMIPYIYSEMRKCYDAARPLDRPMYFDYPTHEPAYNLPGQYCFGDAFIAAPVTIPGQGEECAAAVNVWLPEGEWFNWFNGERYQGPGDFTVNSTLNLFPLLVKGGMPVPMQPYTSRMTAGDGSHLLVECFYSRTANTYEYYEDDGISNGYQQQDYAKTRISFDGQPHCLTLEIAAAQGSFAGQSLVRSYELHFRAMPSAVKGVTLNALPVDFTAEPDGIVVKITPQSIRDALRISVNW